MPSSSLILGSSATFVSLLSMLSAPAVASPLTYDNKASTTCTTSVSTYTNKPCWTVSEKATCTEVVKSSTVTDCATVTPAPAKETSAWGNWNGNAEDDSDDSDSDDDSSDDEDGSKITTRKGCAVAFSTYTDKPCWTVAGKATCTEVVKTKTIDGCATTTDTSAKTTDAAAWSNWNSASACSVTTSTYTNKPCWTVSGKATCTEVVKTTTVDGCATTTKPAETTDAATWGNWEGVTSAVGCGVAYSTYTDKPCWTVSGKATCTEVVKTKTIDGCASTTTAKDAETTAWGNWDNGSDDDDSESDNLTCGAEKTITVSKCSSAAASTSTSCTTYHLEKENYKVTSSCSTVTATPSAVCGNYVKVVKASCETSSACGAKDTGKPVCGPVTKTNVVTSTITSTVTQVKSLKCSTPAPSTVTSCTTYHLEKEGYKITSSCATSTSTPAAVCTAAGDDKNNGNNNGNNGNNNGYNNGNKNDDGNNGNKDADNNSWSQWATSTPVSPASTTSCSTPAVSTVTSCTTYHLEKENYKVTSSCATSYSTPAAVCTTVPVKGDEGANWNTWEATGAPAATYSGIKAFTGAASQMTVDKASSIVLAAAAMIGMGALML